MESNNNCKVVNSQLTLRSDNRKVTLTIYQIRELPGVLDVDIINNRNIVRKHLRGKDFIYGNARPVLNFKKIIRKLWGNRGNPKNSGCHSDVSLANAIKIQMLVSSEKPNRCTRNRKFMPDYY